MQIHFDSCKIIYENLLILRNSVCMQNNILRESTWILVALFRRIFARMDSRILAEFLTLFSVALTPLNLTKYTVGNVKIDLSQNVINTGGLRGYTCRIGAWAALQAWLGMGVSKD